MTGTGVGDGLVDLHSHLVPGVDDGARSLDEAVVALGRLAEAGVRTVVTTPHVDASLLDQPAALDRRMGLLAERFHGLVAAATEHHPGLDVHLGCELLLDVPDPVVADPRLRLASTRYLLVEWPRLRVPPGTVEVIATLRRQGVVPIVAHPERYGGLGRGLDLANEWRKGGALLQVNHGALHGRYGREARQRALTLLERGWVDLMSSDFHGRAHLQPYVAETRAWFDERGQVSTFEALTAGNPRRLLRDEPTMPVAPLELKRGPLERLRDLIPRTWSW